MLQILVKSMLKKHSFGHPFRESPIFNRGLFHKTERSNSAPSAYGLLLERYFQYLELNSFFPKFNLHFFCFLIEKFQEK